MTMTKLKTVSSGSKHKQRYYRVGLIVEFYKDQFVKAVDEEEAKSWQRTGCVTHRFDEQFGFFDKIDLEIIDTEERDENNKLKGLPHQSVRLRDALASKKSTLKVSNRILKWGTTAMV